MAVYFYYGEEDYNIDLEIEKLRSKLNPDFISMCYQVFNNPNYQDLITALRTPPMMFGETLVVINSEKYFMSNKKSSEGEDVVTFDDNQLDDIDDALKNNPENLNIVFVVRLPRGENKKIDSRRKIFKILNKYNSKEFNIIPKYELSNWVIKCAKSKSLKINNDAVELIVEQIGSNLLQIDAELEKLRLTAYPKNVITKDMVKDNCISNEDLFNLTDYIINGDKGKALLELKMLLDKKYSLEISSALQTMIRKWIIFKTQGSANAAYGPSLPEPVKKNLKKVSTADLVRLKQVLFEFEYKIKTAESVDMISEVECAIIR